MFHKARNYRGSLSHLIGSLTRDVKVKRAQIIEEVGDRTALKSNEVIIGFLVVSSYIKVLNRINFAYCSIRVHGF